MLPPRVILNVVYAMLTTGMSSEERETFDSDLYGWGGMNDQANRRLFDFRGGED